MEGPSRLNTDSETLQTFLAEHGSVLFLRLHWVDLSGIFHGRILPIAHASALAAGESSYKVGSVCMLEPISEQSMSSASVRGPVELRPDWTSLKHCTFSPKHASVMCYVWYGRAPNPSLFCTRSLLKEAVLRGIDKGNHCFLVGTEIEFVLLDAKQQAYKDPIDAVEGWSQTGGLRGRTLTLVEEIVESLIVAGIGVWHFHTELACQLEIALEPLPPVEALDAHYFAIETIKNVAVAHGLRATVTPKPLMNEIINGMHIHLSMSPKEDSEHFLAGILQHLHSFLVLGVANYDGYARVGSGGDKFGSWVSWGATFGGNRIGLREEAHWELRFPDATANHYLLLATIIELGLTGIKEHIPLSWLDVKGSSAGLDQEHLKSLGITQLLPHSLDQALRLFEADPVFDTILGERMKTNYVYIKQRDHENFQKMNDDDRRKYFIRFF